MKMYKNTDIIYNVLEMNAFKNVFWNKVYSMVHTDNKNVYEAISTVAKKICYHNSYMFIERFNAECKSYITIHNKELYKRTHRTERY